MSKEKKLKKVKNITAQEVHDICVAVVLKDREDRAVEAKKDWITQKEVFKLSGISVPTLSRWRREGKYLAFSKVGVSVRYRRSDINDFFESKIIEVGV